MTPCNALEIGHYSTFSIFLEFSAAPQAQVGGYERRIGGAALPPNMYGAGPAVSNQPALPAAGAPQESYLAMPKSSLSSSLLGH